MICTFASSPRRRRLPREHLRAPRGWHRLHDADWPVRTPPSTVALLARATSAGPSISAVCTYIHEHEGAAGVRRMLGVLALAKKHGPAVVDEAAKAARSISACQRPAFSVGISNAACRRP